MLDLCQSETEREIRDLVEDYWRVKTYHCREVYRVCVRSWVNVGCRRDTQNKRFV